MINRNDAIGGMFNHAHQPFIEKKNAVAIDSSIAINSKIPSKSEYELREEVKNEAIQYFILLHSFLHLIALEPLQFFQSFIVHFGMVT